MRSRKSQDMENETQPAPGALELLFRVNGFISQNGAGADADEDFNRVALALFAFQFEEVPIYSRLCQIPVLPAAAFKEHIVSSLGENERTRVFHSSGTTEHVPSRHFHSAESLSIYEASMLPWFQRHFLADHPDFGPRGAVFVFLTPNPTLAPHSSLVYMFQKILEEYGGAHSFYAGTCLNATGAWRLEFDLIDATMRRSIADNRPVAVLGTAFSFVHWLDYLADNKIRLRLPAGSRIMETGGYKGRSRSVAKPELRRLMTKFLAVPESHIITEYGMSELSSQAYDGVVGQTGPARGTFHFPPWVRTQIISPETGTVAAAGETGLLRIFDPANIRSVMAIQTEDLAAGCGDGFELLGRLEAAEPRGCSLLAAP